MKIKNRPILINVDEDEFFVVPKHFKKLTKTYLQDAGVELVNDIGDYCNDTYKFAWLNVDGREEHNYDGIREFFNRSEAVKFYGMYYCRDDQEDNTINLLFPDYPQFEVTIDLEQVVTNPIVIAEAVLYNIHGHLFKSAAPIFLPNVECADSKHYSLVTIPVSNLYLTRLLNHNRNIGADNIPPNYKWDFITKTHNEQKLSNLGLN